jgi:hypothetical protein
MTKPIREVLGMRIGKIERRKGKRQAPSTKSQINSNDQISKSETTLSSLLGIEAWDLFWIWKLEFGILDP